MAETKVYTIPLRKEFQKVAFKKRTNKAVKALKEFVLKHTKADVVIVGEELNEKLWSRGITNPPSKVQVEISKETVKADNVSTVEAFVNLVGHKRKVVEQKKKGVLQKEETGGLKGKLKEAVDTLKGDSKKDAPVDVEATEVTEEDTSKKESTKAVKEASTKEEKDSSDKKASSAKPKVASAKDSSKEPAKKE